MPAAALIAFLVTAVKAFTVMVAVVIAFGIRIILQRSFSAPAGSSPLWA
jgi:hypothetical protein